MGRTVTEQEKREAISLMLDGVPQRQIERDTGLSRPFIRNLAKKIGHQFPRNGIEVVGTTCVCANCGSLFRRSPSKVKRADKNFCCDLCRAAYQSGPNHPNWKGGVTMKSFSTWVVNQARYKDWRQEVLKRDGYKCQISGLTEDLEVHHILHKAEDRNPESVFDVNNGTVLNKRVHTEMHQLTDKGMSYAEAVAKLKEKYNG